MSAELQVLRAALFYPKKVGRLDPEGPTSKPFPTPPLSPDYGTDRKKKLVSGPWSVVLGTASHERR